MIIKILLVLAIIFLLFYKTKRSLHMLQQNLYNENNRYIKWLIKNKIQFVDLDLIIVAILLIEAFVMFDVEKFSLIMLMATIILMFVLGYKWKIRIDTDQNKKPLVVTKRIKRLLVTISILYLIPLVFAYCNIDSEELFWKGILVEGIMIYLNAFVVFIANIINYPVEKMVYYHYISNIPLQEQYQLVSVVVVFSFPSPLSLSCTPRLYTQKISDRSFLHQAFHLEFPTQYTSLVLPYS